MIRTLAAFALALSLASTVMAQDAVLMQIEADRRGWEQYLGEQYMRHGMSRADYDEQKRVLERNIEMRRQQRLAEIAEAQRKADLERRQVEAMERLANQPAQAPATNCTTTWFGNTARTSCR